MVGKERKKEMITNAQIKSLIDIHMMLNDDINGFIPVNDISNIQTIKRFQKVLNDLLIERIKQNEQCNELYVKLSEELNNEK